MLKSGMRRLPIALTIAGSDSGGGAGIQADLKTFAALGVHGTSAIACLTAQNPRRVLAALPVAPQFLRQQLETVFEELPPQAIKTGMLYSAELIEAVIAFISEIPAKKRPPLVVDPVMIATSGAKLLNANASESLKRLLTFATVITPNLDEAQVLLDRKLTTPEDLRRAARDLRSIFGCAVLVKGGHLRGVSEAIDFFYDGRNELLLSAPFIRGVNTHGTGCTYSAAIAAQLAKGDPLPKAVAHAKNFITTAIANSTRIARHQALGFS
jgi:hydroxymethylpyrimidine kinase/phosphomethylpyrimidine kinase